AVAPLGGDGEGELLGPEPARPLGRDGGGAPDGGPGDFPRLPQADQQDALRLGTARVEERGLVALSLEVAARDGARHDASRPTVEVGERGGNGAPLREGDGEERRVDLGKRR